MPETETKKLHRWDIWSAQVDITKRALEEKNCKEGCNCWTSTSKKPHQAFCYGFWKLYLPLAQELEVKL